MKPWQWKKTIDIGHVVISVAVASELFYDDMPMNGETVRRWCLLNLSILDSDLATGFEVGLPFVVLYVAWPRRAIRRQLRKTGGRR